MIETCPYSGIITNLSNDVAVLKAGNKLMFTLSPRMMTVLTAVIVGVGQVAVVVVETLSG